jgi:predicted glycosyltransferase
MKIWIDLTNSPHVNFFARLIEELPPEHELILTCRPLANTIELLDMYSIDYTVVGKHYGQRSLNKVSGFFVRVVQLYRFLRSRKPDVSISHSSFYSPLVSKLLGVRSIYLNDNEHAAGNKISFLFADTIMVPEFLDLDKVRAQWARADKIVPYPGVKEGVYLWYQEIERSGTVDTAVRKKIYIRPEPWTAQYYKGERNFMDDLLLDLQEDHDIVLLPRDGAQKQHYQAAQFGQVHIPDKPLTLVEIMKDCDLFIGAGGTMTREAAVLGTPTISIYQDELLDVDRYLVGLGCMSHNPGLRAATVRDYLRQMQARPPSPELLDKGRAAYILIKNTLLNEEGRH